MLLRVDPAPLESLRAYATAAARVARMAVGYWKSPTEATYLASSDASQNHRLEGMPFGTRGGIVARHAFPADGEYKFSIQNFGVGSFVPGEQLALIIDGESLSLDILRRFASSPSGSPCPGNRSSNIS